MKPAGKLAATDRNVVGVQTMIPVTIVSACFDGRLHARHRELERVSFDGETRSMALDGGPGSRRLAKIYTWASRDAYNHGDERGDAESDQSMPAVTIDLRAEKAVACFGSHEERNDGIPGPTGTSDAGSRVVAVAAAEVLVLGNGQEDIQVHHIRTDDLADADGGGGGPTTPGDTEVARRSDSSRT